MGFFPSGVVTGQTSTQRPHRVHRDGSINVCMLSIRALKPWAVCLIEVTFAGRIQRTSGFLRFLSSPGRCAKLKGTPDGSLHSSRESLPSRFASGSTSVTGMPISPSLLVAATPAGVAPMTITLFRRFFGRFIRGLLFFL